VPGWVATRLGVAMPGQHGRGVLQEVMALVVVACLGVAIFRRRAWLSTAAIAVLAVLVLSTTFYPWYLALLLPLAALAPSRIVSLTGPALTALVIVMRSGHWLFGWGVQHQVHHHIHHIHHHVHHIAAG
jgi:hypothetical protein